MLPKPPSCKGCVLYSPPFGKHEGYVPPHGGGSNGVFVVLEAAGRDEEEKGIPTVGKAGYALWAKAERVGHKREGFKVGNVLSCRPPDNHLVGTPFEQAAIEHCLPNLDRAIQLHVDACQANGLTPVVMTLGKVAFKRVMGLTERDRLLNLSYYNYPFYHEGYGVWVVAAPHPSYLVRGNNAQTPVLTYAFEQATRIASTPDYKVEEPRHLCDPSPWHFRDWVRDYIEAEKWGDGEVMLAYDIETPYKQRTEDEEEVAREEDSDYTILRCAFAWGRPGDNPRVVSVPWTAPYMAGLSAIFAHDGKKVGWNSDNYDNPRIAKQVSMKGTYFDGMLAWHVLESGLRKGLGAVVPFYCPDHPCWKHWSGDQPALYNACDADVTLRCWHGIYEGLRKSDLWGVFDRHVFRINYVLSHMRDKGVLLDPKARLMAERKVQGLLDESDACIQKAVPTEVKPLKVYKKEPKDLFEEVEVADGYELREGERWA